MTESESNRRKTVGRIAMHYLENGDFMRAVDALRVFVEPIPPKSREIHEELVSRRTRFFIGMAKEHSVRFSAFLLLIVAHTARKFSQGKRGQSAGWHQTAEWYGHRLGVNRKQVFRFIDKAEELGLLEKRQTSRGVLVWLLKKELYTQYNRHGTERTLGFYYPRLAGVLGLNASMVYCFLKEPDDDDEYRRVSPKRVSMALPWMTERDARNGLEKLWHCGAIQRDKNKFHVSAGIIGYRYFWQKRTAVDRQKWRAFVGCIRSLCSEINSAQNVHSVLKMSTRR